MRAVRALALVDVGEVQADGALADLHLAGAGGRHLDLDHFKNVGFAVLMDVDRRGFHAGGRVLKVKGGVSDGR
jgi:hypothetical protein